MMSNRRCVVLQPSKNPSEPAFEINDAAVPEKPLGDNVLLKVLACGICHADSICVLGSMDVQYPAVPGHEVIGKIVKVGAGDIASTFTEGTIVGVGWHGDHCLSCEACSDGDFICCQRQKVCGAHIPGGYQQYMVASARALARVPEEMDPVTAAPIMCAGVSVFNSLRTHNDKAKPPALVAVVGIGGLGHLAIQYGVKMGYTVAAISRGKQKKDYALKLGATHYIDSEAENASDALKALGRAKIILCTATNSKAMADCIDGLGRNGKLIVLGVGEDPITVMCHQLIRNRCSIVGHASGNPRDSQDALEFAKLHGIVPKTVVFDGIDKAPEAYSAMMMGEHRVVIKIADE